MSYVYNGLGNMGIIWVEYGENMGKKWGRYGINMGIIWGKYRTNMGIKYAYTIDKPVKK